VTTAARDCIAGGVVTIDGPAGAGKTTVARALAARLGYRLLDTGAMYRALAWSVTMAGLTAEDGPALREHLDAVRIDVKDDRVYVDGHDVTAEIRTPEIGTMTSRLTTLPAVRDKITPVQRRVAAEGRVVLEGRDTGTVVCPDAGVKFYLDASLDERARRRHAELARAGVSRTLEAVREEIAARDAQDQTRAVAPLLRAEDAIAIDTTALSIEQVVDRMVRAIEGTCSTRS
jgi:cytidylate kinase